MKTDLHVGSQFGINAILKKERSLCPNEFGIFKVDYACLYVSAYKREIERNSDGMIETEAETDRETER